MDGGVRFKWIEFDAAHWDFVALHPERESIARNWFEIHRGEAYDLMGNLRFLLGFMRDSGNKWFCSEALAAALGMVDPWRYGPNGLYGALIYNIPAR